MELTKTQKLALSLLAASPLKNTFYWTGGTLLSTFYLRHRLSLDLDFFSETPFDETAVRRFINLLKRKTRMPTVAYQKVFDRHEFFLKNKTESLRIEFVYFNHEKKTLKKRKKYLGVWIDSLEDIAANKVMALFERNEPKDLFDLYCIMQKRKFSAQKLLNLERRKFGMTLPEMAFWGECYRALKKMERITPLLPPKTNKKSLLKKIEIFIKTNGRKFLYHALG